ncbi:MAG: STAS domain-containing protein [bacterium]|nr:STAS domain-containing protein [bacterium]
MENISISLSESGHDREVSEIRVDGVVDTLTANELEQVIDSLLRRGRYKIVIDLAGVDYISSAGWGIFISHIKDVRSNAGDIKLAGMVPDVHEIFELLEFDKVLQIFTSVDDAVERFGRGQAPTGGKKKGAPTKLTVVEEVAAAADDGRVARTEAYIAPSAEVEKDPELVALQMVKNDPFVTISEIRRELKNRSSEQPAGWWRIFFILKRNNLLRKRSRFRYAWGRT